MADAKECKLKYEFQPKLIEINRLIRKVGQAYLDDVLSKIPFAAKTATDTEIDKKLVSAYLEIDKVIEIIEDAYQA